MNKVTISYCPLCRWMLRAAWIAQELLSTFEEELDEVALRPSGKGVFTIEFNGELLWERVRDEGFPEAKEIKKRLRDQLDPARDLGHIDR
ncbi:SelT/SelW/SelH family protein [Pokkaliibacter sp. CJK22405]|uniref:SelT/SelW/SelH family protein n=1 Tax=Pokkaliibacter sp. CJK22405 TaxID=3384615 RepID=UPI0039852B29